MSVTVQGHEHIDLLKIDIEGWEFETLEELIKPYLLSGKPLPFAQLQLEIHVWDMAFEKFLKWWEMLEAAGLRPFWTEVKKFIGLSILASLLIYTIRFSPT